MSREGAERALLLWRAKPSLKVYYDPEDPTRAVLLPGVRGLDYAMFAFLYPFVASMLASWYLAWKAFRFECLSAPAGGLPARETAVGLLLQLDDGTEVLLAGAASCGAAIVLSLGVGFAGLEVHPPVAFVLLALDLGVGVGVYVTCRRRASTLLLQPGAFTLYEHARPACVVSYAKLRGILVREQVTRDTDGDMQTAYLVACVTQSEPNRELSITKFSSPERALALRDWLLARIGLPQVTTPPQPVALDAQPAVAPTALPHEWRSPSNSGAAFVGMVLFALITAIVVYQALKVVLGMLTAPALETPWWKYAIMLAGAIMVFGLERLIRRFTSPSDLVFAVDHEALYWGRVAHGAPVSVLRTWAQNAEPGPDEGFISRTTQAEAARESKSCSRFFALTFLRCAS